MFAAIADETQEEGEGLTNVSVESSSISMSAGHVFVSEHSKEESGLGAIYRRSVSSPFQLKSFDGQQNGELSSTGIYLRENGSVGTIQQIDLFA